ncbi:MAG: VWA domain-containing protein [Desulforhabdus sp.]|jgi:Ca-activated chloride channel family protein|nr:VWA domain-containing protein [Desulforhabdus sp.]
MTRKRFITAILLLAGMLVCGLFVIPIANGAGSTRIVFILDASGSMWGRVDDATKMESAREVMSDLIASLPENTELGLVAYGHRRKGDCQDIEVIAAPGSEDREKMREGIKRLTPKGKTPLAASLTQAGDYLRDHEGDATMVLVSDGLETCGGDPCAVAKRLHRKKTNLTIHVVGFDVSGRAVEQLQCVAEAGGGRYFQADTVASLAQALAAVGDHAAKGAALPEPAPKPQAKTEKAKTTRIKVAGPGTVALAPAPWVVMPPKYWLLTDAETGAEVARAGSDTLRVKPGTYHLIWRQSEHGADDVPLNEIVTVKAGDKITVPLTTGIRITVPENVSPPYRWRLVNEEQTPVAEFQENLDPQLVPAGTYHLVWRQTEQGHPDVDLGEITIKSGQLNERVIECGIVVNLPDWLQPPYYYSLLDQQGRQIRMNQTGVQVVPAGTYQLTWKQSEHGFSEIKWTSITVPQKGFAQIAIDSGLTFVSGDDPAPYRIYAQNMASGAWAEMADSWGPLPLPPGTYRIEMQDKQHESSRVELIAELPIGKGQLIELEL